MLTNATKENLYPGGCHNDRGDRSEGFVSNCIERLQPGQANPGIHSAGII